MEELDIIFEAISWPHFDREKMMATPLGFLASRILREEGLVISEKLWRGQGGREYNHFDATPLRLERNVRHILGHSGNKALSCLKSGRCAGPDRSLKCNYHRWESRTSSKAHTLICPWKIGSHGDG